MEQGYPSYCVTVCNYECIENSLFYQFWLCLVLTMLTLVVSCYHIGQHLKNFNNPFFQSKIIVIMLMAPFYCLTSMGAFLWPNIEAYFTLFRDFYESILLFTFFYLIFSYLAYDRNNQTMEDKTVYLLMIQHEKQVGHFFPFKYCQKPYQLSTWKKAKYFTYRCKKYVLQFLVVKMLSTIVMILLYPNVAAYEEEAKIEFQTYGLVSGLINWVVGISASYSLYYLVLFYHALHRPLAPYSPLLKFLTVKVTLFFTFWQRIMIVLLEDSFLECFSQSAGNFDKRMILSSLENTLICVEMLIMAFAAGLAYDSDNYVSRVRSFRGSMWEVLGDTMRTFWKDSRLIRPKKFGFDSAHGMERQLKTIPSSRNSTTCTRTIKENIYESSIEHYF